MLENPFSLHSFVDTDNRRELYRRIKYRIKNYANSSICHRVNSTQFREYFKFSFVRNPWDRAYSWYQNVMRDPVQRQRLGENSEVQFADFLRRRIGKGMLKRQTYWLKNFAGEVGVDFVGRFEKLNRDFEFVCKTIGLENINLPHEIKGSHKQSYTDAYNSQLRELVAEFYAEEINEFGYQFETG